MCDLDVDPCAIYESKRRLARKPHRCEACRESIRPGDCYTSVSALFDGRWSRWSHCERCDKISEELMHRTHNPIPAALDCGELWVDTIGEVPPEIDALAFWLPGDDLPA